MQMQPVVSSNIAALGHDAETSTLRVQFNNGSVYDYQHVSEPLYQELLTAESVGGVFSKIIKKNPAAYPYTKVA